MKTKFENSNKTFIWAAILCFILMIWKKTSNSHCYKKKNETKAATATRNVEYKYIRKNWSCKNKHSQLTFPCSNWTRETLEKDVKYVQS